jgi:hypothetical protein
MWTVAQWTMFTHKVINTREGNVPLPLGLVKFCALADYSGGLNGRCRKREIRHAGKVSIERGGGWTSAGLVPGRRTG